MLGQHCKHLTCLQNTNYATPDSPLVCASRPFLLKSSFSHVDVLVVKVYEGMYRSEFTTAHTVHNVQSLVSHVYKIIIPMFSANKKTA